MNAKKTKEYKTPIQGRINQQRAAEQQPKLITPNGWGAYARSWGGKEGQK